MESLESADATTDQTVYRLVGHLGILNAKIRPEVKSDLKKRLKLKLRGWRDEPATEVKGYLDDGTYFWVPRFYFPSLRTGLIGNHSVRFEWVDGAPQDLNLAFTLDPARGQPIAVDRMVAYLKEHSGGLLVAPTSCLAGDTHIAFEVRDRTGRRMAHRGGSLELLYRRFNGLSQPTGGTKWADDVDFFVQSVSDDDLVRMNKVEAVVDSGEKFVYRISTASGKTLKATADHEFMTETGFRALSALSTGDRVCINPRRPQSQGGRRATPYRKEVFVKYHPTAKKKVVNGCTYHRLRVYQAVFEAHRNGLSYSDYVALLNDKTRAIGADLWTIPAGQDVHHLDEDHNNNAIENLILVGHDNHAREHHGAGPKRFIELDQIVAIDAVGVEHVYDVVCAEPYRNFVAEGIVVHNCGKTLVGYAIGQRLKTSIGVLVYNGHMLDNWVATAKQAYGLSDSQIGVVRGDQCDLGKPVTVMMVQSLLARTYPPELYQQIGCIVADEVHHYGAPQWNDVMRQFPARYRLGLSADPKRDDGLDRLIGWHFGKIGHTIVMATPKPAVVQIQYQQDYKTPSYSDWDAGLNDGEGGWNPNPVRYDKVLQRDAGRNAMIVEELVKARLKGRKILLFSRFNDHLTTIRQAFLAEWAKDATRPATVATMLIGGLKDAQREAAMAGDVVFTNYVFARDALNMPTIDTLVFATPPGKPLQPIGRLRDKGPADRRPLLALDIFELASYSRSRARRRRDTYDDLGHKIVQETRSRRTVKQ